MERSSNFAITNTQELLNNLKNIIFILLIENITLRYIYIYLVVSSFVSYTALILTLDVEILFYF